MNKIILLLLFLILNIADAQNKKIPVSITNPKDKFEIIGELGLKIGDTFTVEGKVVEGNHKGYEHGPNLLIKTINNLSTQKMIKIPIKPYWGKFGENSMPKVITGKTYRFRVYETGEYVGIPKDAYVEAKIQLQTTQLYFRNELVIISGEQIKDIDWSPSDFVNREALISGLSKNINDTAYIIGSEWRLKLLKVQKWKKNDVGKVVEAYGKIIKTNSDNTFIAENCQLRLVKLKDQLEKKVKLRGTAWSMNGHWWFNYRGIDLYVENMSKLPNWTSDNHGKQMEIMGFLDQDELPRIDQIVLKKNRDLQSYYIICNASWSPIDGLLTPEVEYDYEIK